MCTDRKPDQYSVRERADRAHAAYSGARSDLLREIAALATTEAWRGDGAANLSAWLSARWQIGYNTARELVRQSEDLRARPPLQDALQRGAISLDQCKALAVLCREGADDAEAWLECLPFWSVDDLQREARKQTARALERRDDGVYFRVRHTADERYVRGEFQLHPEDGASVIKAIEARIPAGTRLVEWDRAAADALVEVAMCSSDDASRTTPERTTVMVSVTEGAMATQTGAVATLASGGYVAAETARRMSCDARIQTLIKDQTGHITGIGRTSRSVPPWLRRAVEERDGGVCTFPGCARDKYLHVHHAVHWSAGGPTDLDNLMLTCRFHHALLHEGEWSVSGRPGANLTWLRPDGSPLEPRVRVTLDTS